MLSLIKFIWKAKSGISLNNYNYNYNALNFHGFFLYSAKNLSSINDIIKETNMKDRDLIKCKKQ